MNPERKDSVLEEFDESGETPKKQSTGFLSLPAELRLKIYDLVLGRLVQTSRDFQGSQWHMGQTQCSLLYVSHQVRDEVIEHFQKRYLGLPVGI